MIGCQRTAVGGISVLRCHICSLLDHVFGALWPRRCIQLRKLELGKLDIAGEDSVLLHESTSLFLHGSRIDLVSVPHMRVLLAPLFKGLCAAGNWTCEWLFTSVSSDMVFESTH